MITERLLYWLMIATLYALACSNPKAPNLIETGKAFEVDAGIDMQLIASEPLVIDPVAFTFDRHANMYVVEHRGYPDPVEGGQPAKKEGRIAKLMDVNQDGVYDTREEYAIEFTYPNGIMYWRGGVFVTCAPDIYYLKDTTGDGQADIRNIVLTGFHDTKTAQIRMSHPTLGLDGWIYITGGLNGGDIISPEYPDRPPVSYQSGDGRFHPETFEFEVTGGRSQFGLTMDPFGRRFGCSNRHPVQHIVIEPRFLARNPYLLHSETVQNVSKVQEEAVVYSISGAPTTADFIPKLIGRSHQGTFTAASGLLIFADAGLGVKNQGNVFICESAQSLVQNQTIRPSGVSFVSEIARDGSEFLACRDEWFRPVFLGHGPQPGLYIADMRRKVIDHPSYVPEAMRADLDFSSGRDEGRIYRLVAHDFAAVQSSTEGTKAGDQGKILKLLTSRWEWQRAMAFQILLEQNDASLSPLLKRLAMEGEIDESRVRALWLLHLLGTLDDNTLGEALQDPVSNIREQATQICIDRSTHSKALSNRLIQLSTDPDVRVRFLTSLALGSVQHNGALDGLAKILARDGQNSWSRAAALSSIGTEIEAFLNIFQGQEIIDTTAYGLAMQDLGTMVANGGSISACRTLFSQIIRARSSIKWQIPACLGLFQGFSTRNQTKEEKSSSVSELVVSNNPSERALYHDFLERVATITGSEDHSMDLRKAGILLLGAAPTAFGFQHLYRLLKKEPAQEIKMTIVQALTSQGEIAPARWLLNQTNWPLYLPPIRAQIISALLSRDQYTRMLLEAMTKKIVLPSEISASDRNRLMRHGNSDIAHQSNTLFKDLESGTRMEIYERYKARWKKGHAKNGQEVFNRACAICHAYAGQGGQVGPDLTGVKNQPADALLLHTLVPNYEVYPNYQAMTIRLHSGETKIGWIKTETDHAITILSATGNEESLLRSSIRSIQNTGRSLMPDGLEQTISPTEMNDLITYLKSGPV